MGDANTLLALAARCEAATGPDRELDADIMLAIGIEDAISGMTAAQARAKYPDAVATFCRVFDVPPLTASLDAAVSLVPAGWDWEAHSFGLVRVSPGVKHPLYCKRGQPTTKQTTCATPALALCAAALRARAAMEGRDDA